MLLTQGACSENVIDAFKIKVLDSETLNTGTETDTDTDTETDTDTGKKDSDSPGDTQPLDTDSETGDTDTFTTDFIDGLYGYAKVNSLSQDGTTGGLGDDFPVTVTTGEELQGAVDSCVLNPCIIIVEGSLTNIKGRVLVDGKSNISIIGKNADSELNGFGLTVFNSYNIIIENLSIHNVERDDKDCINISGQSHHVWINHCNIFNDDAPAYSDSPYDSLIDISHASDFITVSWCNFYDHVKTIYIGHSDDNIQEDTGHLKITFHHNVFKKISPTVLSYRFGTGHFFNNLFDMSPYFNDKIGVAIASRMGACVRIENNVFDMVYDPVRTDFSGDTLETLGAVQLLGNEFTGNSADLITPVCEVEPPYQYKEILNAPSKILSDLADKTGPK
ncbi:MAG: hypothetical protein JXR91_08165 [Deltaproteobacteria bacterium]|nr:hypothetical protein [Deltaproteobacteria bacterium]